MAVRAQIQAAARRSRPGDTCTPSYLTPAYGSPFTFVDNPSDTSSATFVVGGVTSDGLSTWDAVFTMQFNAPYRTVLADYGTDGFTDTYSATANVAVTPLTATPEPDSIVVLGTGLLALAGVARRRLSSR